LGCRSCVYEQDSNLARWFRAYKISKLANHGLVGRRVHEQGAYLEM
jgi:hypothetical protein